MKMDVNSYFKKFYKEINKYAKNVNILNEGATEEVVSEFEQKYNITLPYYYREWLKLNNGGELFAVPAGTVLRQILGNKKAENGAYLEYNFDKTKRWPGMPKSLFIIANLNYGDLICFDLKKTTAMDGIIVCWDHETASVCLKWNSFRAWLEDEMQRGKEMVNYDGELRELF